MIAFVIAELVDRALSRRGREAHRARSPAASCRRSPTTRLRLVRRLIFARDHRDRHRAGRLPSSTSVQRVATGILASSAVLGLVVGFAARQTLANGIAGILLAITQPIRIGDLVTFEDETGEVEDVRLTYTYIRLDDGRRLIVPNERLAQSSIENHTIVDPRVQVEVSVWLPPSADLDRALELIEAEEDGVSARRRRGRQGGRAPERHDLGRRAPARARRASPRELRRRWLRLLREHGLSSSRGLLNRARAPAASDDLPAAKVQEAKPPRRAQHGAARPRRDRHRLRDRRPLGWPATCSRSPRPRPT